MIGLEKSKVVFLIYQVIKLSHSAGNMRIRVL
jgi:hypothetical protein